MPVAWVYIHIIPLSSVIKCMLMNQEQEENPLKKLLEGLDRSEFGGRGNWN